jgi:phosphopantetheine adenylyltransferase
MRLNSANRCGLIGCRHENWALRGLLRPLSTRHLDIAIRAARLLDALYIGVGVNPDKHGGLFAPTDRVDMVRQTLNWHLQMTPADVPALDRIQVVQYNTLVNEAADCFGAHYLVRGMRASDDFSEE